MADQHRCLARCICLHYAHSIDDHNCIHNSLPALTNLVTIYLKLYILYTSIDKTLVNSLHGLLNCERGGLDCHVITAEYSTRVY